tara:strand:+ start:474 stop:761 length:288 start_codon:yes stop_codon:yes gene_type:complete
MEKQSFEDEEMAALRHYWDSSLVLGHWNLEKETRERTEERESWKNREVGMRLFWMLHLLSEPSSSLSEQVEGWTEWVASLPLIRGKSPPAGGKTG